MSSACTPILVGMVSPVLEILLPSKTAKFPFRGMVKKIMQVGIDVKCMHTDFGGHGLSSFRDIATFKNGQISLLGHGL